MSAPPTMTMDALLRRLEEVLGADSLLFRRFERGLRREDERALTDAMNSLVLYPAQTRRLVEDTVTNWLFGARAVQMELQREAAPRYPHVCSRRPLRRLFYA
jgi:hypothetical protein